jgi:sporulation protein YlmC with PRC-barrel domain
MMTAENENGNFISSDKVEGTAVYGANGERIGSIQRLIIEKKTGQVSYAVLSFGGFLGIGDDHYPISWKGLTYNTELGGYQTDLNKDQLEGAPKYSTDSEWDWDQRDQPNAVDTYYGAIWGMPLSPGRDFDGRLRD